MDEQQQPGRNAPSFGRKILKIGTWLILIFLVLCGTLLALLFVYEDDVKSAIIGQLNKHLKAEVKIDPKNIDLTIIKTFPDCSIQFDKVLILEALQTKQRDTLIYAERLNLLFNIKDLWNKKYAIQKIKVRDALLKPKILANGANNYTIWEAENSPSKDGGILDFNLELLSLDNCSLNYSDLSADITIKTRIKKLNFKGNFKAEDYIMSADGMLQLDKISSKKAVLLADKDCIFSTALDVKQSRFSITSSELSINQLRIALEGAFTYKDSLSDLNVSYKAPDLDIAAVLSLLPAAYKDKINDYKSSGHFYVAGRFQYKSQNNFLFESNFGIKKGSVTYKPQSTTLQQVDIDGYLKYGSDVSELKLKNIFLKLNNDEVKAMGQIKNFGDPYLDLSADANLNLANLQSFWPIDTLSRLQGNLKIKIGVAGLLSDLKKQTFSSKVKLNVNASLSNLEAQFKNDEQVFSVESGSVMAMDRELEVQNLRFKRGVSDLLLNGKLPGFFNYLSVENAPLVITGNLSANYIRLEDFMMKYNASGGESDLIPAHITFKLDADIGKFSYAKFSASNIKGEIDVKNQKAIVSDMTMNTVGGSATIDAFAQNANRKLNVVLQSKLKGIDVTRLFSEFNNFGQATLQDKNIKGFLSANIDFSGTWNNQLDVDLNTLRATCDLNIEKGELIDFKPLVSLSKFVDIEDLKHIKFSTLQSEVLINRQTITFPKTVLMNSALNIVFSGTHTFDNMIDYHIQLVISELLAKRRKADDEFGPIEEDKDKRRNAFILMTGPLDNPKKTFDRKGQKEKIKEDWKQEKQSVKQIFREEFGSKKNDLPPKEKKSDQKFELEKPGNNPPKKTLEPKKKPVEEDF